MYHSLLLWQSFSKQHQMPKLIHPIPVPNFASTLPNKKTAPLKILQLIFPPFPNTSSRFPKCFNAHYHRISNTSPRHRQYVWSLRHLIGISHYTTGSLGCFWRQSILFKLILLCFIFHTKFSSSSWHSWITRRCKSIVPEYFCKQIIRCFLNCVLLRNSFWYVNLDKI